MSAEEHAIAEAVSKLMVAIGQRPIKGGNVTLNFDADGLLQSVKTETTRRVRKAAPNHQPPRTSGTT